MKFIRKYQKVIVVLLLLLFVNSISIQTVLAITGSNSMPEYRSFEPVNTTNMVNLEDGSFTYNIPLLDVPNGSPISISYHSSEVTNEAQASWVGLGWTLNPGAVNRSKRGFPDEYNKQPVTYFNKMPKDWTLSGTIGADIEFFSKENNPLLNAGLDATIRYNNYKGFSRSVSLNATSFGASVDLNYSGGHFGFSPKFNFIKFFNETSAYANEKEGNQNEKPKEETIKDNKILAEKRIERKSAVESSQIDFSTGSYGIGTNGFSVSSMPPRSYPIPSNGYFGLGFSYKFDIGTNLLPIPADVEASLSGSYVQHYYDNGQDLLNKPLDFIGPGKDINTYGYFYLENATKDDAMDYYTQNESSYDKKLKYLGAPFPNNDVFNITGESIGGSFRAYRPEIGHYTKRSNTSCTVSAKAGADVKIASGISIPVMFNQVYGIGADIGGGYNQISTGQWLDNVNINQYIFRSSPYYQTTSNEKLIFRYDSDLGGNFDQAVTDDAFKASLSDNTLDILSSHINPINGYNQAITDRVQRNSYVGQHLNKDFNLLANNNIRYAVEEKNLFLQDGTKPDALWVDYNDKIRSSKNYNPEGIGEIYSTNNDGVKYIYGLPIHCRNEKNIHYSLPKDSYDLDASGLIATPKTDAALETNSERKLGFEVSKGDNKGAYASQFLLTQINSSDYIDRTYNGPTPDDFGSYSRFNYTRVSSDSKWYGYRSPFSGLCFDKGSLSDPKDNMGTYEAGEKEIIYLQSVVSKTHVAIFTLEDRKDGIASNINENGGADLSAPTLQCLKQIDLYSISDCDLIVSGVYKPKSGAVPIKTVHLKYDYSSCPNLPNNINKTGSETGKLTLTKIWFEYNGKSKSKIAPYVFDYNYPVFTTNNFPVGNNNSYVLTKGIQSTSFLNYGINLKQNPDYSMANTDSWGNYRDFAGMISNLNTSGDLAYFWPFVNQNPNVSYDPAAWCLKKITLPSGGQILIQYEQNSYQYVQNKRVMEMIPLTSSTSSTSDVDQKYYIDLKKMGFDMSKYNDAELKELTDDLFQPFVNGKDNNRMYFKFLYQLVGNLIGPDSKVDANSNNSEYIEGYARISGYGYENDVKGNPQIFFKFVTNSTEANNSDNYFNYIYSNYVKREIPKKACKDFYNTSRQGLIEKGGNSDGLSDPSDRAGILRMFDKLQQALGITTVCANFEPQMSFVRLQVPLLQKGKLGGGVRVKRLLMYDEGLSGTAPNKPEAVVYGNEYEYTTSITQSRDNDRITSSGVATNEPSKKESALVFPLDRNHQEEFEALQYGEDMYGQEGPMGESLLPSPHITYSEVKVSNIHKGKTSTGYEIHKFYTTKDYPMLRKNTEVEIRHETPISFGGGSSFDYSAKAQPNPSSTPAIPKIPVGVKVSFSRTAPHVSQGYAFILNEMNGKPKSIEKFANNGTIAISSEVYTYYEPGEKVNLMDENFNIYKDNMGKTSEMLGESYEVNEFTIGAGVGADFNATYAQTYPIPPVAPAGIPLPLIYPKKVKLSFSFDQSILRSHVFTKIINYPAILKSVKNQTDKVSNVTEYQAFDKYTGSPVRVVNYDDFHQSVLEQDYKASWVNQNMRSKSINENVLGSSSTFHKDINNIYYIEFKNADNCNEAAKFVRGDLVELCQGSTRTGYLFHVDQVDLAKQRLYLVKSYMCKTTSFPSEGTTYDNVLVQKSGYTNQLNALTGKFTASNPTSSLDLTVDKLSANTDFVKDLNALLNSYFKSPGASLTLPSLKTGSTTTDGYIIFNGTYSNLKIYPDQCSSNYSNSCNTLSGIKIHVNVDNTNKRMSLKITEATIDGTFVKCTNNINNTSTSLLSGTHLKSNSITNDCPIIAYTLINKSTRSVVSGSVFHDEPSDFYLMQDQTVAIYRGFDQLKLVFSPGDATIDNWDIFRWSIKKTKGTNINNDWVRVTNTYGESFKTLTLDDGWPFYGFECGAEYDLRVEATWYSSSWIASWKFGNNRTHYYHIKMAGNVGPTFNVIMKNAYDGSSVLTKCVNSSNDLSYNISLDETNKISPDGVVTWDKPNYLHYTYNFTVTDALGNLCVYNKDYTLIPNNVNWPQSKSFINNYLKITFTKPGTYNVTVTATNINGISTPITRTIYLSDCLLCQYNIVNTILHGGCMNSTGPVFDKTSLGFSLQKISNCDIVSSASWIIVDPSGGTPSTYNGLNINYNATIPGNYIVQATSINPNSSLANVTKTETVTLKDCRTPSAKIAYTPPTSCPDKTITLTAIPDGTPTEVLIDSYKWDIDDGTVLYGKSIYHAFNDCKSHIITLTVVNFYGSYTTTYEYIGNNYFQCAGFCDCESTFPIKNIDYLTMTDDFTSTVGMFYLNSGSGKIVWQETGCPYQYPFDCLSTCSSDPAVFNLKIPNVIKASAITYSDNWSYEDNDYLTSTDVILNADNYDKGKLGKWRPNGNFVYRDNISGGQNKVAGTFILDQFNWIDPSKNDSKKWVLVSTTNSYSPNGHPVEDVNLLNIYSTALYGYNNTLPVAVAQNAQKGSVVFESFENIYSANTNSYLENGLLIASDVISNRTSSAAHTGNYSLIVKNNAAPLIIGKVKITSQILNEGVIVKAWFKNLDFGTPIVTMGTSSNKMTKVTASGEWTLYEGKIPGKSFSNDIIDNVYIGLQNAGNNGNKSIYMDDIRLQPKTAEMVCYTYDSSQRIQAVLDDQNFALIYQYNAEGMLVRKLKETVNGVKTVSETQYNSKGEKRY